MNRAIPTFRQLARFERLSDHASLVDRLRWLASERSYSIAVKFLAGAGSRTLPSSITRASIPVPELSPHVSKGWALRASVSS